MFSPDPDVAHDSLVSEVPVGVSEAALHDVPVLPGLPDDVLLLLPPLRLTEHEHQPAGVVM